MDDHSTIDGLMAAFYATISGEAGQQDWARAATLMHPRAQMVRTRMEDGSPRCWVFDYPAYVESTRALLAGRPFYEVETAREVARFAQIAQVFSTYEAREHPDSSDVIFRGVNMLHLWRDGDRWWIMAVIWDNERAGITLPARWLFAPSDAD